MDASVQAFVLTGIVAGLGAIIMGLFWRALAKSDAESDDLKKEIDHLKGQITQILIDMANKINREDMERVFKKIEDLSNTVITALGHRQQP